MQTKNYKQYINVSYSGRELLKKHSLADSGLWQIHGEDANPDLHGSHHMPDLGIVEGALGDVIAYAVELPRFWQWGGGGTITKIGPIPKINPDTIARRNDLMQEERDLKARLEAINKELKALGV